MDSEPTVSFVVVNYNGGELLAACLASIRAQTLSDHEVIVVDNGSTDGSERGAAEIDPRIRLLRYEENLGFAEGSNRGIRECRGRYVALVNNDAVLESDWATLLVAALEADASRGAAAGRVLRMHEPERLDCAGFEFYSCVSSFDYGDWPADALASVNHRPFGAVAAAAMYRRAALDRVGLFHPEYFCYYEDTDLAVRLVLFGYDTVYVDEAVARHVGSATRGLRSDFHVYHLRRNAEYLFWIDMVGVLTLTQLPYHVVFEVGALAAAARRGQAMVVLRAKRDALKRLPFMWRARRCLARKLKAEGGLGPARHRLLERMRIGFPWVRWTGRQSAIDAGRGS